MEGKRVQLKVDGEHRERQGAAAKEVKVEVKGNVGQGNGGETKGRSRYR